MSWRFAKAHMVVGDLVQPPSPILFLDERKTTQFQFRPSSATQLTEYDVVRPVELSSTSWITRQLIAQFVPLDEAIVSRAVFVIVPESARRADGRRSRFWSQLNYSKTVRDRSSVSIGS